MSKNMLQCYNRGCGQLFDPEENTDESCCHHPGEPFFHDAYKGWSCCNKKSVDFTEFLNTKGCTLSKHSNEKPPEPEKPQKEVDVPVQQEIRSPIKKEVLERPNFNGPLTTITADVAPGLKAAIDGLKTKKGVENQTNSLKPGEVEVGTTCKNRGCSYTYTNTAADYNECQHHPGFPIFHEGMKYWSCCQKKTTDFTAFMAQVGCTNGSHKWFKDDDDKKVVSCRYDWHQTATNVIVAVYAKLYHYEKSIVQVNPIRLSVCLVFPDQEDAEFNLDLELRGIIKVDQTSVQMYGTKVEITMPKAEAGSWAMLDFPRKKSAQMSTPSDQAVSKAKPDNDSDSDFDLDDIEHVATGVKLADIS